MKSLAVLLLLLTGSTAFAQTPKKVGIRFTCMCKDAVASQVASSFRDVLATSPRYMESTDPGAWVVSMISIDASSPGQPPKTALSSVMTLGSGPVYSHWIATCGVAYVRQCAEAIFAKIDQEIADFNQLK